MNYAKLEDKFNYEDSHDINDNDHDYDNSKFKKNNNNFAGYIEENFAEHELRCWVGNDEDALVTLNKCIKWMEDKKWEAMKEYLHLIDDETTQVSLLNADSLAKISFVKNFYLGISFFRTIDYKKSLEYFFEASKYYQYYQLNYNIALCYIKTEQWENAVFYLEACTKKEKNFFFAYYNLIKIYLRKNNINDAYLIYRDFSDIIKKEKESNRLPEDMTSKGRLSVTSYTALKLFYKLGAECCFAKALYQECVHTLLEALKFNPEDPELWCLYGKVFIMKKSFDYAKPLLKKAIDLDPEYKEAIDLLEILNNNV